MSLIRVKPLLLGLLCWLPLLPARAQGYHVDQYPALGQNPGNLNQDLEDRPGSAAAPAGWTEVLRLGASFGGSYSRGIQLPAGFDFRFNGQPVRAVRAYENFLKFDTLAPSQYLIYGLPDARAGKVVWLGRFPSSSNLDYSSTRVLTKTFGTAPHRQYWIQWSHLPLGRNPFHVASYAYVSVVLEETSHRFWVVYQRSHWPVDMRTIRTTYTGTGAQLNGTTFWPADTLRPLAAVLNNPTPTDNHALVFEPGPRPAFDAAIWTVRVPAALPSATGAPPTRVRGTIINNGTQPLRSWRVFYRLNGGAVQALPPAVGTLAPGDTVGFRFPGGWNRAVFGEHQLRVWVSTDPAQPDAVPHNDTLAYTLHVASREVPRRVLEELATSSTCPPCAIYDDSIRAYVRRHPERRLERIGYPMDFPGPGDPYYLPEFKARMTQNLRGIRNVFMYQVLGSPLMIDNGYYYVDATDRFTFPPMPPYDSLVTVLETPPAYVAISGTCRPTGTTLAGTVTLTPTRFLPGKLYTLQMVIVERRTTANARTNGKTEFFDVAKKILPPRLLTAPLLPEQAQQFAFTYTFPAGHTVEHFDSLEVVAFVQYTQPLGTPSAAEVIQVMRLRPGQLLGAPEAGSDLAFTLAPNPSRAGLVRARLTLPAGAPVGLTVSDVLGRVVLRQPARWLAGGEYALPLDLDNTPPGLYVVRLTAGAAVRSQRLVLE